MRGRGAGLSRGPERVELAAEVDIDNVDDPLPIGSIGWRVLNCLADEVMRSCSAR
jgi:hypothetical protein